MRILVGGCALAILSLGLWILQPYMFLPSGTTLISLWNTDKLHECSEIFSSGRVDFWMPTAKQVAVVDNRMAWMMSERESAHLPMPPGGQRFNGQYIGFTRKGARYIYGNFFPSSMVDDERWTSNWSPFEKPVCVADGGRSFWGVVYDVQKEELGQPVFNGPG